MLEWFLIAAVSAAVAAGLTPLAIRMARRVGAIDHPDGRKQHGAPTPLLGGVAVFAAILGGMAAAGWPQSARASGAVVPPSLAALAGAALVFAAGLGDDLRGLSSPFRLCVQSAAALVAMAGGLRFALLTPDLPAAGLVNGGLTLLWIVGVTNAFNFIDGMDGLAAGLAAVTSACLGGAALLGNDPSSGLAAAVAGASLGFLPYNFRGRRPARIFLGDAGSMPLGFLLACLALSGPWHGEPLVGPATSALALALPIYDMVYTTVARVHSGAVRSVRGWLDYVGRDHIHHRLTALAGGRGAALVTILAAAVILGVAAIGASIAGPAGAAFLASDGVLLLAGAACLEWRAASLAARRVGAPAQAAGGVSAEPPSTLATS